MSLTAAKPRDLTCARCGAAFECGSTVGRCWCAEEDFRLPLPGAGEDCLCPACLRAEAARQASVTSTRKAPATEFP